MGMTGRRLAGPGPHWTPPGPGEVRRVVVEAHLRGAWKNRTEGEILLLLEVWWRVMIEEVEEVW